MSRNTIRKGLVELAARKENPRCAGGTRMRKQGGGRKRLTEADPASAPALDALGRAGHARRSDVAVALDLQEHDAIWPKS